MILFSQYHLMYHIFLESDEESTWVDPYKKETNKIRKLYANFIWSAWAYERLWGPRFGRIIISNNITDAAKVCFFCETIEIRRNLEYLFRFYWFFISKEMFCIWDFLKANLIRTNR
jgi:hypothetical protein